MKVLYIGSSGNLSLHPLRYLLQTGYPVCAVAIDFQPHSDSRLPVFLQDQNTVEYLARASALPVINLSAPLEECVAAIRELSPDLILVSCYSKKLPRKILDIPVLGCLNFHPSLLPAYRGPAPLFWQFRDGVSEFGVTLHYMNASLDAGDVVMQLKLAMPDGVNYARSQQLLAESYVELLSGFLPRLSNGRVQAVPQDEAAMSYQGFPTVVDFRVDTRWSAKRIFNFICATSHYGQAYPCVIDGNEYRLESAFGYSEALLPEGKCVIDGNTIQIACCPGILLARFLPF